MTPTLYATLQAIPAADLADALAVLAARVELARHPLDGAADDSEAAVTRAVRLATRDQAVLWRNNVGLAVYCRCDLRAAVCPACGAKRMRTHYGVYGRGGADWIGIQRGTGRFVALEIKRPNGGKLTDEQATFLRLVHGLGAVAGVVRSGEEAIRMLGSPVEPGTDTP